MDSFELKEFNKRINLNTDLKNISKQICIQYDLGEFVSNELFEEWKYLNNLAKRAEIASTLSSNLMEKDAQGNEQSYLHIEWIVRKIMKLTDEDIAENEKYKLKEKGGLSTEGEGGGMESTGPGADFFSERGGEGGGFEESEEPGGGEFGGEEPGGGTQSEGGTEEFGGEPPETPEVQ